MKTDLHALCSRLGITIEREVCNSHRKLYLRNAHGRRTLIVFSCTTRCARTERNQLADLRRFAKVGSVATLPTQESTP